MHCDAASFADTDWTQILDLYDQLVAVMPTPVVALNRAIALGDVESATAALSGMSALDTSLDGYHLFHAARADLLRRTGSLDEAADAYSRALALAPTERERDYLASRLATCRPDGVAIPDSV